MLPSLTQVDGADDDVSPGRCVEPCCTCERKRPVVVVAVAWRVSVASCCSPFLEKETTSSLRLSLFSPRYHSESRVKRREPVSCCRRVLLRESGEQVLHLLHAL